jgi:TRAP-type C4-dicarboxylate transport system permease large subunit
MAAAQKANDDEKVDLAAADNYEFTGYRRHLQGWQGLLLFWICVAFTVFHLLILNVFPIDSILFRAIHVGWGGVIAFAVYAPLRGRTLNSIPLYDWLFILLSIACAGYVAYFIDELQFRAGALYEPGDVVAGAIGTLLILEMTRRTAGLALPIIAGLFILYCFVGPWLPGMLYHKGYDFGFFFSYIYSDQGIFGVTTQVSSTYIVLFITFGAFLTASKAGDYMNDLAVSLVGWARGGPAKVAVLSGILFGTISGSAVGNVVASGMITIPMMRRVGYDRSTAGAIEATSSTGGQITPPVMGAGAFLMAEITGIPYTDIALAAVIPCLLFYLACYVHCDLHAVKHGLRGLPRNELTPISKMLRKAYLLAPIFVLIGSLLMGYSEFRSGTLGILSALIVSWLHRDHRMGPRATLAALETAARETAQLVAICACAGIIVGVIALTGVGGRFSHLILGIAGESQVLRHADLADPRHGHAHHGGLCRRRFGGRAWPDPHRGGADRGAYVHLLLCRDLVDHAAGGPGLLRRGGHRPGRSVAHLDDRGETRACHLHRAVHVLRQPAAAGPGRPARHPVCLRHGQCRGVLPGLLHRGLAERAAGLAPAHPAFWRRDLPDHPGNHHRHHRRHHWLWNLDLSTPAPWRRSGGKNPFAGLNEKRRRV